MTINDFFQEVAISYQKGQSRSPLEDAVRFLSLAQIKWELLNPQFQIANLPTIITVNHFTQSLLKTRSLLSTMESFLSSAIVTCALAKITRRNVVWIVKNNLPDKWLFVPLKIRRIQKAMITCYGFIGSGTDYPGADIKQSLTTLRKNQIIALYPEGEVGQKIKNFDINFQKYIEQLIKFMPDLQIIPISIWCEKKKYFVRINPLIKTSKEAEPDAQLVINRLSESLPLKLR